MAEIIPQLPPRGQTTAGSLTARGQRLQNRFLTGIRNQQIINSGIMEMLEQSRAADVRQAAANRLADSARGIQGPSPQRFGFQTRIAGALPPSTRGSAIVPITNVATKTPLLSRIKGFLGNPIVGALTLAPPLADAMTATGEFMRSDRGKLFKDGFRNFDVPQMLDAVAGRQVLPRDRGLVFTSGEVPEGFDPSAPDALSTALEQARESGVDGDSFLRPRAVDTQESQTDEPSLSSPTQRFDTTLEGQYQRYFGSPEFDNVFGSGARGEGAPKDAAAMEILGNQLSAPEKDTNISSLYAAQSAMGRVNEDKIQQMYADRPDLQEWAKRNPMLAQREYLKAERRRANEAPRGLDNETAYKDLGTRAQYDNPMGKEAYARIKEDLMNKATQK